MRAWLFVLTSLACAAAACAAPTSAPLDVKPDPEATREAPSAPIVLDSDAGDAALGCTNTKSIDVPVNADTILIGGKNGKNAWCAGANHAGTFDVLNVGAGIGSAGAFRFELSAELLPMIADPMRAMTFELVLERADTSPTCGDGACPFACGNVTAFGLRSDWDEGAKSSSYDGADWCRRTSGQSGESWEQPGATGAKDRGPAAGTAALCEEDRNGQKQKSELHVPLATAAIAKWLEPSTGRISVLVAPEDGAVFTASARGSAGTPARLHITYCAP